MIVNMNRTSILRVKNPTFSMYASRYLDIQDQFLKQIESIGIEIDQDTHDNEIKTAIQQLEQKGAILRNDDKSIYINRISPACIACREGVGSATFFISLQCNRDCYFCFNPNQENYEYFIHHKRNLVQELDHIRASGQNIHHLALTGGEPLLHTQESIDFFRHAKEIFPNAHSRLYTCGDFIDDEILQALKEAGLQEIRFSIRLHDRMESQQETLDRIALSMEYIPSVMVEMPVLPDSLDRMKEILIQLDQIGISSINLLEFCFPFRNARTFRNKGYQIKNPTYRVLYDYWYAGGLPIAGSERVCLQLIEFAIDEGLEIGVHYCSLENKHTGQIYQQNYGKEVSGRYQFSEKDFFFKSAKVFGEDIPKVLDRFREHRQYNTFMDTDHDYLEFHPRKIDILRDLEIEVGLCYFVYEIREEDEVMRELKVDLVYPEQFDFEMDV
jgi:pyruvate formate-lyase activating enzyme-like uncharacterized protein